MCITMFIARCMFIITTLITMLIAMFITTDITMAIGTLMLTVTIAPRIVTVITIPIARRITTAINMRPIVAQVIARLTTIVPFTARYIVTLIIVPRIPIPRGVFWA